MEVEPRIEIIDSLQSILTLCPVNSTRLCKLMCLITFEYVFSVASGVPGVKAYL